MSHSRPHEAYGLPLERRLLASKQDQPQIAPSLSSRSEHNHIATSSADMQVHPGTQSRSVIPLSSLLDETIITSSSSMPRQTNSPNQRDHMVSPTRRRIFDPARDLGPSPDNSIESPSQNHFSETGLTAFNSSKHSRFRLHVIQQPVAARACGHGERDRRVIDPPPILQLKLADFDHTSMSDLEELQNGLNVVQCKLYTTTARSRDVSTVKDPHDPEKIVRSLMGTSSCTAFQGLDPNLPESWTNERRLGIYYIFHDLSCRHTGRYRLCFQLASLSHDVGDTQAVVATTFSADFEVYNPKDFPGMQPSTALSRELKRQGANLPIKKGAERNNRRQSRAEIPDGSEESVSER